jgi:hypothetical protein
LRAFSSGVMCADRQELVYEAPILPFWGVLTSISGTRWSVTSLTSSLPKRCPTPAGNTLKGSSSSIADLPRQISSVARLIDRPDFCAHRPGTARAPLGHRCEAVVDSGRQWSAKMGCPSLPRRSDIQSTPASAVASPAPTNERRSTAERKLSSKSPGIPAR